MDIIVAGMIEAGPQATPPASPVEGSCYVVADNAAGAWSGREGQVAAYTAGGWRFVAPVEGMMFYVKSNGETAVYRSGGWEFGVVRASSLLVNGQQVVGAKAAAIADPAGGSQVDSEARISIAAILAALRQHGLIAT